MALLIRLEQPVRVALVVAVQAEHQHPLLVQQELQELPILVAAVVVALELAPVEPADQASSS